MAITNGNLALNGVKVAIKSYMHIQIQMILIALLELKTFQISNMQKDILLKQDYSSRCMDIGIGNVAIWKNIHGHYLLTLVKQIQDDTRDHDSDLLECEYKIIL